MFNIHYLMYRQLLGIFHNSVSKCYVVYLRHIVFDSVYFTGEFIDYTDNIISFVQSVL